MLRCRWRAAPAGASCAWLECSWEPCWAWPQVRARSACLLFLARPEAPPCTCARWRIAGGCCRARAARRGAVPAAAASSAHRPAYAPGPLCRPPRPQAPTATCWRALTIWLASLRCWWPSSRCPPLCPNSAMGSPWWHVSTGACLPAAAAAPASPLQWVVSCCSAPMHAVVPSCGHPCLPACPGRRYDGLGAGVHLLWLLQRGHHLAGHGCEGAAQPGTAAWRGPGGMWRPAWTAWAGHVGVRCARLHVPHGGAACAACRCWLPCIVR